MKHYWSAYSVGPPPAGWMGWVLSAGGVFFVVLSAVALAASVIERSLTGLAIGLMLLAAGLYFVYSDTCSLEGVPFATP